MLRKCYNFRPHTKAWHREEARLLIKKETLVTVSSFRIFGEIITNAQKIDLMQNDNKQIAYINAKDLFLQRHEIT